MDDELIQIFCNALKAAKTAVLSSKNKALDNKANIQTKADIISQDVIINFLKENNVSCKIYSEELDEPLVLSGGKYDVVMDPLDGSFMFLKGIRAFASIAVIVLGGNKVKCAFVQSIAEDNLYHCDEKGAYLNGNKINCIGEDATKTPYLIAGYSSRKNLFDKILAIGNLKSDFRFLNSSGSLFSAMVASNNISAAIEFEPASFYEFAGAMIAQKAGAFVETAEGNSISVNPFARQTLIVANSKELLKEIQQVLK